MSEPYDTVTGEIIAPFVELEMSAEIGEIFGAIAKAQGSIENATKDRANEHFKSKYATLAAVYDACRKALSEAGVAVVQAPFNAGEDIGVVTMLGHSSGQWLRGRLQVKPMRYDAQGAGSVITYLRRYILSAMVGVAPDDDDGEAAVGRPAGNAGQQQRTSAQSRAAQAGNAADQKPAGSGEVDRNAEANERDKIQGLYNEIAKAIHVSTSGDIVDQIYLTREADIEKIRAYSETSYDKLKKRADDKKESFAAAEGGDEPPI